MFVVLSLVVGSERRSFHVLLRKKTQKILELFLAQSGSGFDFKLRKKKEMGQDVQNSIKREYIKNLSKRREP